MKTIDKDGITIREGSSVEVNDNGELGNVLEISFSGTMVMVELNKIDAPKWYPITNVKCYDNG